MGHAEKSFQHIGEHHDLVLQGLHIQFYSEDTLSPIDSRGRTADGELTVTSSDAAGSVAVPRTVAQPLTMATRHFFIDEAGDLTIFNKRGRSMLGQNGVSKCFMVGVAEIENPAAAATRLEGLRTELLNDPYFAGASSLQPERRKTAVMFHAKDDLPEVRWRVYEQLRGLNIRVAVAIRRKAVLEAQARTLFGKTGRKLRAEEIYDALVTHLFIGRLHDHSTHHVTFSTRKKASRDAALARALERARIAQPSTAKCVVASDRASGAPGLQVIDYYLWAVQRLFELSQGRFFAGMCEQFEYVWDLDDTRNNPEGVRYDGVGLVLTPEETLPLASTRFEESLEHPA